MPTTIDPSQGRWSGHSVLALRTAAGLPGRDFARALGLSWPYLKAWENDPAAVIGAIAEAALDTFLTHADKQIRATFHALLTQAGCPCHPLDEASHSPPLRGPEPTIAPTGRNQQTP